MARRCWCLPAPEPMDPRPRGGSSLKSARKWVSTCRVAAVPFPLLFAALTGRSGHGLAPYGPRCPAYSLGLYGPPMRSSRSMNGTSKTL